MENPSLRMPLLAVTFMLTTALCAGCAPANQIVPLRGEDPDSLAQAGERIDWLRKTGATRAVESFRAHLLAEEYGECMRLLGPATLAVLKSRAASSGLDEGELLEGGGIEGLGLRGADDPVAALRAGVEPKLKEYRPFDPTRTSTTVLADFGGPDGPVEIPAVFTPDGWRIELVRITRTDLKD